MKLIFSFCLFLMVSMVLVSSMAHAGAQLWDFDNIGNEKDWEEANGDWQVKKGIFQETSGGEAAMHQIVRGVDWEKWEDYTVSCKIRIDEGNSKWAGLIFRAQKDNHEYYVYYLNVPDNKTEFWVHLKGAWDTRRAVSSNIAAAKKLQKEKNQYNIYNILLILGVSATIIGIPVSNDAFSNYYIMIAFSLVLFIGFRKYIPRFVGVGLAIAFVAYLVNLLL